MISRLAASFAAFLLLWPHLSYATAASVTDADEQLTAAEEAYESKDVKGLEFFIQALQDHLLVDYVRYWYLHANLKGVDVSEVKDFLKRYPDGPLAQRLRTDWLKQLGKNQQWDEFAAENTRGPSDDTELLCYQYQAGLRAQDSEAPTAAKALWLTGKTQPESCDPVFGRLIADGVITNQDIWERLRLALEAGNVSVARRVNDYLTPNQSLNEKHLEEARRNPQRYLGKRAAAPKTRAAREVAMFAVLQIARKDAGEAAGYWSDLEKHFPAVDQGYVWGQIGYRAALNHEPGALGWFKKAGDTPLPDIQLAWRVRAALRALNWQEVLSAVDRMSAAERDVTNWRYWKARALRALDRTAESKELLGSLTGDARFYGQLAREELGSETDNADPATSFAEADLQAVEQAIGIKRALLLNRLGLSQDGVREWNWAIRSFDDRQLIAASEVARRASWHERSIYTAERTTSLQDHNLRFPTPFRDVLDAGAQHNQLDNAWVLGLIRQESRFTADARSGAGALGLMQIMPSTARWIARQAGLTNFHPGDTTLVEVNITLGTFYLRHVLDELGHPVLATAAYNAGPMRAARWRGDKPMEGAIYAETIPFNETRDYVRKVMLNATIYANRLGMKGSSLKERLGTVPGKSAPVATGPQRALAQLALGHR